MPSKFGSARIEKKKFWDRMRMYGYTSGVLFIVILIAYVFLRSPLFKINQISIETPSEIDEATLIRAVKLQLQSRGSVLGTDSYFSWDNDIVYRAPNVSSIDIERSLFSHSVVLKVIPRERFMVWCKDETKTATSTDEGRGCFWTDENGILFEHAPETEGQLVTRVSDDTTDASFALNNQILNDSQFKIMKSIAESDIIKKLGIRSFSIVRSREEVVSVTPRGTKIFFSLRFDPATSALPALVKFTEDPGLSQLEYVNLTVENRAFIKYR